MTDQDYFKSHWDGTEPFSARNGSIRIEAPFHKITRVYSLIPFFICPC